MTLADPMRELADRELLLKAGHSMAKALEIELDINRGEPYATSWIAALRARKDQA